MTTRMQIVNEAYSWLGTKFIHQARLKGVGIDCAGLIECIAQTFQLVPNDYVPILNYPRDPSGIVENILRQHMDQINVSEIKPGSVIFFGFGEKFGQHLGIYTDKGTFIHAHNTTGKVTEVTYAGFWIKHTLAAFDYRGIQ